MALAAADPVRRLALTIADCDTEIASYWQTVADESADPVLRAIARFEIDRWLDRRLTLMARDE